ncbi:hypothetical protein [Gracilibacillus sp. YIM 98692]|uniref:DUF6115 domain-containing protein n=1 Tax=Gracilibacillus sp. YIM 98692 TaxID=2663532 RepID=UPI0013D4F56B|nr:hypothetical protein [Gracilibacillus sp. YIM 98692]
MVYLLLLLSFLIHIITFIIIRQWKVKQNEWMDLERKVKKEVKSLEDTLSLYLVEIKEENQTFVEELKKIPYDQHDVPETIDENGHEIRKRNKNPNKEDHSLHHNKEEYYPPAPSVTDEMVEPSKQARILHLFQEGYQVSDIAKKLDTGKTEIELILKFHKKNDK